MAKELKPEQTDFYKISETIQVIGYKAEIDGQTLEVRARAYDYIWRTDGSRQLVGVIPAKGIIKDLSGRITSETEEGFTGLTDIQMWQLANAGVIILSSKQERGHISRFRKYIKDNISATTSTDY